MFQPTRHPLWTALLLGSACTPPYVPPDAASEASGTSSDTSSDGESSGTSESSSEESGSTAECEDDSDCGGTTPYCDAGECVDCTAIGHSGCFARDPTVALCDPASGQCIQCTDDIPYACEDGTPICTADGFCVACTDASECETYCDAHSGYCDAAPIDLQVYSWELVNEADMPVDWFTIDSSSFNSSINTADETGLASFSEVPWSEEIRYEWRRNQLGPVTLTGSTTRISWDTTFPASSAEIIRVPYLFKSTAGRIAFECGLFPTLDEATGFATGDVPAGLHQRSALWVKLPTGPGSTPIDRKDISFNLDGWEMFHQSEDPGLLMQPFVCDIESSEGIRVGAPQNELVGTEGWFAVFGLRDLSGLPTGFGSITVPGYVEAAFRISGWGEMAYVELAP